MAAVSMSVITYTPFSTCFLSPPPGSHPAAIFSSLCLKGYICVKKKGSVREAAAVWVVKVGIYLVVMFKGIVLMAWLNMHYKPWD